jgi:hypothetical protein
MASEFGLDALFDSKQDWTGIQEKAEEVGSTEDYVTNGIPIEFSACGTILNLKF